MYENNCTERAKAGAGGKLYFSPIHFTSHKTSRIKSLYSPVTEEKKKKKKKGRNAPAKTCFLKSPSQGGKEISTDEPDKQIFHPLRESVQFYHLPLLHV